MSNPRRHLILAAVFFAAATAVPLGAYLTLNFASLTAQGWIVLAWLLVIVAVNAVTFGRLIARWRAKRAKVPDGPEADYHDPPDVQRNG